MYHTYQHRHKIAGHDSYYRAVCTYTHSVNDTVAVDNRMTTTQSFNSYYQHHHGLAGGRLFVDWSIFICFQLVIKQFLIAVSHIVCVSVLLVIIAETIVMESFKYTVGFINDIQTLRHYFVVTLEASEVHFGI